MLLRCLLRSCKALTKANRCCWSIKFIQTNGLERYLSGYTMINFLVQVGVAGGSNNVWIQALTGTGK